MQGWEGGALCLRVCGQLCIRPTLFLAASALAPQLRSSAATEYCRDFAAAARGVCKPQHHVSSTGSMPIIHTVTQSVRWSMCGNVMGMAILPLAPWPPAA